MMPTDFSKLTISKNFLNLHSRTYELNRCEITSLKRVIHEDTSGFLSRTQLMKLKFKAVRTGTWFKALQRIDRALVDLTIKVAENIRSFSLAKRIFVVVSKLKRLLESPVFKSLKQVGHKLAEKISSLALRWGNVLAKNWASDLSFAFFLAVTH